VSEQLELCDYWGLLEDKNVNWNSFENKGYVKVIPVYLEVNR